MRKRLVDPRRNLIFEREYKKRLMSWGIVTGVDSDGRYCQVKTDEGNRLADVAVPRGTSVSRNDRAMLVWDNAITRWRLLQIWEA